MPDKTILVVDPDAASLKILAHVLQEYALLTVSLGKEGLISAWRDRPDLIIFDPAIQDLQPEEFIKKLKNDSRSAETPILAFSRDRTASQRDTLLQTGCSEYLVKSGDAVVELPEVVARLLGIKTEVVKEGGYLIAFLSAKGGTGTSSLCANLGAAICNNKPEASVAVVDMVLPVGSIASIVGYQGGMNLVSVAEMPSDETVGMYFHDNLPKIDRWEFQLLAGATNPEQAYRLKGTRVLEIVKELQFLYDYVVIDLGRSLSRISLSIIQKADLLTFVVGTEQSTIALPKTIWDYLQTKDIDAQSMYVILNRAVDLEGLTKTDAEKILELPIQTAIPYFGSNFMWANNLHQPLIKKYPNDTVSIILRNTASRMMDLVSKLRVR